MTSGWESHVKDMVTSTEVSETELRAFTVYQVFKDRLYMEVLCDVLGVLAKRGVNSSEDVMNVVWGAVTIAGVSLTRQTATGAWTGESAQLEEFTAYVEGMALNDFGQEEKALDAYRGKADPQDTSVFARVLGAQLCSATDCSTPCPDGTFDKLAKRVGTIERETTLNILDATVAELEAALLAVSYVQTDSHEH